MTKERIKIAVLWLAVAACTIGFSQGLRVLFYEKPESLESIKEPVVLENMTINELAEINSLKKEALGKIFKISSPDDYNSTVSSFNIKLPEIKKKIKGVLTLQEENSTKNWLKIPIKFLLWFIFMGLCLYMLKKGRIREKSRLYLYGTAVIVFGVILGADPSPMGTVKDAIVLYGSHRVVFPPRMIAFAVFLAAVIIANKFICSWGCQFGALQDLIFRINRLNIKNYFPQFKIPFAVSQGIRVSFFIIFTAVSFFWMFDIVGLIDPFKVFKPAMLGVAGAVFLAIILFMSLFVYRPWCTLFCPFGLTGWLAEKVSIFNIKVNYDTCIACEKCLKMCPSTVMESYLKQDRIKPDCFSCGTCIENCPTGSISFTAGKRLPVPEGKFKK